MFDETTTSEVTTSETTSVSDATVTSQEVAVATPEPTAVTETPASGSSPNNDVTLIVKCQSGPDIQVHMNTNETPGAKIIKQLEEDSGLPYENFAKCQLEVEGGTMLKPFETLAAQGIPAGTFTVYFSWIAE